MKEDRNWKAAKAVRELNVLLQSAGQEPDKFVYLVELAARKGGSRRPAFRALHAILTEAFGDIEE